MRRYSRRLETPESPSIGDFLNEVIKALKAASPVRVTRKEAIRILSNICRGLDPALLFEQWERKLRQPVLAGYWATSYSVYSDSLVIEYVPDWSQIERATDIRGRNLHDDLVEAMSKLSATQFSIFLANLFSRVGWAADVVITKLSRDGGIDFQGHYLYPDQVKVQLFGQAKHWTGKVGSEPIRTFIGSVVSKAKGKASVGVYVCSGGFSEDALKDIREAPFKLLKYDISELVKMMIELRVGVEDFQPHSLRIDASFWDEIGT